MHSSITRLAKSTVQDSNIIRLRIDISDEEDSSLLTIGADAVEIFRMKKFEALGILWDTGCWVLEYKGGEFITAWIVTPVGEALEVAGRGIGHHEEHQEDDGTDNTKEDVAAALLWSSS